MAEKRYTIVFTVAVVVALMATYGVYKVMQANAAGNRVPLRTVVIAAADIPEGGLLERVSLATARWPAPTVPEGAYTVPDSLVGRVTRVAIFKGEVLVPGRLAPVGASAGLEVKIAPGKRAMAIKINDVSGISGMVQPNSRVDVLLTLKGGFRGKQLAKLFMENMRVLSIGANVERDVDGKVKKATTATLEVTPEQAEHLALAEAAGSLQLVLRGFGDRDSIMTEGATKAEVLAQLRGIMPTPPREEQPEPRRAAPPPRRTAPVVQAATPASTPAPVVLPPPKPDSVSVDIYRGTKAERQKFAKDTTAARRP